MMKNYKVYVSANRFNKIPSTVSKFTVESMRSYVSDVTVGVSKRFDEWESFNRARPVTRELKDFFTPKSVPLSSCHSLTREDVSKVISDENVIPFSLERLQWRGNLREAWIPLKNKDDIISRILDIACCNTSTDSAAGSNWILHVSIKKETILPHHEFEAMVNERKRQELVRDIQEAISLINQQQTGLDRPSMAASWNTLIEEALMEMSQNFGHNSLLSMIEHALRESAEQASARAKLTPAIKSSIEALEVVIIDNQDSAVSCAICMEKMVIGSAGTRMPCYHTFHKNCILTWLELSKMCPLCRQTI